MPKFKILITMDQTSMGSRFIGDEANQKRKRLLEDWSQTHFVSFKSRAEATTAYHALIAQQEDEVSKAEETLNALVENGHIVEVEENG